MPSILTFKLLLCVLKRKENYICHRKQRPRYETKVQKLQKNGQQKSATSLQHYCTTNQVVASCANTDFWLVKIARKSCHTQNFLCHLLQNKFALGRAVKRPTCMNFFLLSAFALFLFNLVPGYGLLVLQYWKTRRPWWQGWKEVMKCKVNIHQVTDIRVPGKLGRRS